MFWLQPAALLVPPRSLRFAVAFVTAITLACSPEPSPQAEAPSADPASASAHSATQADSIWALGVSYDDYLASVRRQAALWRSNSELGLPDTNYAEQAAEFGRWRLLFVAFDGCSDSVHTLPYVAALADAVDGLELRVVEPDDGAPLQERFRSPDGRTATPTLVVLGDDGTIAGCWVEQPTPLQNWWLTEAKSEPDRERFQRKMAWYAEDRGQATLDDVLRVLEGAAAGTAVCERTPVPSGYPGQD